ncbi:hypothetical protein ONZ45_g17581 [Pleurotus djamor]|nr:hypothetical protein ONZ45_g17581 [Pleurotus djamor]
MIPPLPPRPFSMRLFLLLHLILFMAKQPSTSPPRSPSDSSSCSSSVSGSGASNHCSPSSPSTFPSSSSHHSPSSISPSNLSPPLASSFLKTKKAYKKVENRIKPVATTLPEQYRIVRRSPPNILEDLRPLPTQPPEFVPGVRYTQERHDAQDIDPDGWLSAEEIKLAHWIIRENESAFAWTEEEKGSFSPEWFDPVVIPTIEHVPWAVRNMPIPPGIYDEVIRIIKDKIASGVYEPSSSSYRSGWFCVLKKDGKSLRIVHDLRPLNAVTIKDASLPPIMETYAESHGGRACYALLDLFVGFDQRLLAERSRDLTTFQTPIGAHRLTSIPMGFTNSMQIQHGDLCFIMRDEMPHVTDPFVDDCPIKGPLSRYELSDGTYETIPENPSIRRFVFEHFTNLHRVIHRMKKFGGTFSGVKLRMCVQKAAVVGHICSYDGREADPKRVEKVRDWPIPRDITDVRGFLGTIGVMRIFIKDFAIHARPLVHLTRKDVPFVFGPEQLQAMKTLSHLASTSPALRAIDHRSQREVILAVDSSVIAVGFVLSQLGGDGKRYPSRFGSITWNDRESRYSQAKLELYGLFRALLACKIWLVGAHNLVVEVDAKYIKDMINNPDILPNAAMNRWVAAILTFTFSLRHVPAKDHTAPDGLSRRRRLPQDSIDDEDVESWIDEACGFHLAIRSLFPKLDFPAFKASSWTNIDSGGTWLVDETSPETQPTAEELKTTIPRSPKAIAADKRIQLVDSYLRTGSLPPGLEKGHLSKFTRLLVHFFVRDGKLWRKNTQRHPQVYIPEQRRLPLIRYAHDSLGHKGIFVIRTRLLDRFWWPMLDADVRWFVKSCHECQIRLPFKLHIPPTPTIPLSLMRRVHIDTMLMPVANKFKYLVQARCSLTGYPEWRALRRETAETLGLFIFQEILCRWGAVEELVTDNGTAFVKALDYLAEKYRIRHIRISPYNSQANGIVERSHRNVRDALMKTVNHDEKRWVEACPAVFWAERVTISKVTGYSPYYLAHGLEPLFPFDIHEATYLIPSPSSTISTSELLALRARQLQKRPEDLERVREHVVKNRLASLDDYFKRFAKTIKSYDFKPGDLVLVRDKQRDGDLSAKHKPRYNGPMIVVRRTDGGAYVLSELDGTVSSLRFSASRVIPYFPRYRQPLPAPLPAPSNALEDPA